MKNWGKYIKPYLKYFILGPLCMVVEVLGEITMPKLFSLVINNNADGSLTVGGSIGICLLMILCALVMLLGGVGGAYFGSKASVNFATDLRYDLYKKTQEFSFTNIDKFSSSSILTRLTNDVTQIQNFLNMLLRMALRAPGMMIGGIIMAIILCPKLSVVFAVTIPIMLFCIIGLIAIGFPRFTRMQKKIDGLNSTVQENITNVRVVKSFVREDYEEEKFNSSNTALMQAGINALKVMVFLMPLINLIMYSTIIAVIYFGHGFALNGDMEVGDLSAFITYVTQILTSLMMVTILIMASSRAMASAKRVREILDEKIDITEHENVNSDTVVRNGKIEFRNVYFKYFKNTEEYVLNNINFSIEPGSTVGIIGSTGCGKSTLVSMIPRLYDVDSGEVLIDGINVKDYSLYNLREGVGMVLQKNVLFAGSISENLRWGDINATDEEVVEASTHAAADKFVSGFKNGYNSVVEKGGANLSGGQRQRLCIARALLKKPKILILDDSTSAVDTATERQIQKCLREDLKDCTKIIIAQRINSVIDADKIVVMDDGVITGIGTHDELIENNTEYKEIYYSQMDKEKGGDK